MGVGENSCKHNQKRPVAFINDFSGALFLLAFFQIKTLADI